MSKPNTNILTDIDGVCLTWIEAYTRYMLNQGYEMIREHKDHSDLGSRFDIPNEEANEHVRIFNSGHWEFGTLLPELDSKKWIAYLAERGYRFIGISSCSTSPQTIALRKANLYNVFGDVFDEMHCVEVGESKRTHLADHEPTIWIEDKPSAAMDGLDYGHTCILLTQPWNEDVEVDSRIKRVDNWEHIVSIILEGFEYE